MPSLVLLKLSVDTIMSAALQLPFVEVCLCLHARVARRKDTVVLTSFDCAFR